MEKTCDNCYNNDDGMCSLWGHSIDPGDAACEDYEGEDDE